MLTVYLVLLKFREILIWQERNLEMFLFIVLAKAMISTVIDIQMVYFLWIIKW